MCTHIRENCRFVQKVQPKVTKVELFEGIFLKKDMCNICLISGPSDKQRQRSTDDTKEVWSSNFFRKYLQILSIFAKNMYKNSKLLIFYQFLMTADEVIHETRSVH